MSVSAAAGDAGRSRSLLRAAQHANALGPTRPVFILGSRLCLSCPFRALSQFIKLRRSRLHRRLGQNGSGVSLPGCNCVFHFQQLGDELLMRLTATEKCVVSRLCGRVKKKQTTPSATACRRGQRLIKDLRLMKDERLLSLLQQLLVTFFLFLYFLFIFFLMSPFCLIIL